MKGWQNNFDRHTIEPIDNRFGKTGQKRKKKITVEDQFHWATLTCQKSLSKTTFITHYGILEMYLATNRITRLEYLYTWRANQPIVHS